jgi:hypothetical protein
MPGVNIGQWIRLLDGNSLVGGAVVLVQLAVVALQVALYVRVGAIPRLSEARLKRAAEAIAGAEADALQAVTARRLNLLLGSIQRDHEAAAESLRASAVAWEERAQRMLGLAEAAASAADLRSLIDDAQGLAVRLEVLQNSRVAAPAAEDDRVWDDETAQYSRSMRHLGDLGGAGLSGLGGVDSSARGVS